MSVMEVGQKLVALCQEGKNQEAITQLYSPDIVSVEAKALPNMGQTQQGIEAIKGKNQRWVENHEVHSGSVQGPFPHGERFIVHFTYEVTPKHTGTRMTMDEMGLFTVENGKITKEEFFYAMG